LVFFGYIVRVGADASSVPSARERCLQFQYDAGFFTARALSAGRKKRKIVGIEHS
jgi:hypothetical protein